MALSRRFAFVLAAIALTLWIHKSRAQPTRAELEAAAQAGWSEAAYQLGLDFDLGTSGPEDTANALRWYRRAAEAGLPAAEFNVGVMLDSGRGVPRDAAEAALWYAKAAVHGHARAAYDLGQLYAGGDGVPRNQAAASAWFAQASALPAATRRLAALKAEPDPSAPRDAALLPPIPVSPADGGTVLRRAQPFEAEFVWTAPAEPCAVRFFIELVATDSGAVRRVFAGFADVTAELARLDGEGSAYAWRVYAVDPAGARYAASGWARFTTAPAPAHG